MPETIGSKGPIEKLEVDVFRALDRYLEARLREVEDSKHRARPALEAYEDTRRQLAEAEQEFEEMQDRMAEFKSEILNALVESSESSELQEGISKLQEELDELTEAEQSTLGHKRKAEERLRRLKEDFGRELAEATDELAAITLATAEESTSLKSEWTNVSRRAEPLSLAWQCSSYAMPAQVLASLSSCTKQPKVCAHRECA